MRNHLRVAAIGLVTALGPAVAAGAAQAAAGAARAPGAQAERAEYVWPERWGREGERIKGVIRPAEGPLYARGVFLSAEEITDQASPEFADAAALEAEDGAGEGDERAVFRAEDVGAFLFAEGPEEGRRGTAMGAGASLFFRFVSGTQTGEQAGAPVVDLQRTWFALYDPVEGAGGTGEAGDAAARGIALVMPGLYGTPESVVDGIVFSLRRKGWAVLRMMSQPSRFTEEVRFSVDMAEGGEAGGGEAAAARIAGVLTDRAAECAYAVQAAFDHVARERPDLPVSPRIAVGNSGGAMTLPTVVAREPERYAGAVLIAGGAHFWRINSESNYADLISAIELEWAGGAPTEAERERLAELYLAKADLDPYYTADSLRGKPILMIHGTADKAVPAELGDLLWERLGRPERWTFPVGHEVLHFPVLPGQYARMTKWLDAAFPRDPAPAPSTPHGEEVPGK